MTPSLSFQRDQRYLVTGSSGYLGRHLIQFLQRRPTARIFGLDCQGDPKADGWRSFEGDLLDSQLPGLLAEIQPDVIFHAAAAPKTAPLQEQLRVNVIGTEHLLASLQETQISARVVVIGSAAEYGPSEKSLDETAPIRPRSEYGIAKAAQGQTALVLGERLGLPVLLGRVFNVYGATVNTLAVASLASQIARQEQQKEKVAYPRIKVQSLLSCRDFIHVNDVVRALLALSESGRAGEIYNIGSGEAVQLGMILQKLKGLSRLDTLDVTVLGDPVADRSEAGIGKIMKETGWKPGIPLDNGLKRELDHWRQQAALLTV